MKRNVYSSLDMLPPKAAENLYVAPLTRISTGSLLRGAALIIKHMLCPHMNTKTLLFCFSYTGEWVD